MLTIWDKEYWEKELTEVDTEEEDTFYECSLCGDYLTGLTYCYLAKETNEICCLSCYESEVK